MSRPDEESSFEKDIPSGQKPGWKKIALEKIYLPGFTSFLFSVTIADGSRIIIAF